MYKRVPIKNHHTEVRLIFRRSLIALFFVCALISLLIFRLAHLQIIKHHVYSTLAVQNWLDLVPLEPTRGLIYDRNGILLAENIPVFSLEVTPVKVADLSDTIKKLSSIISLSDNDIAQFKRQLKQHRRFDSVQLKLKLTEQEVAQFTENQHRFPGVAIHARLMRHYPNGEDFSHVIGYVGRINTKELQKIDQANYSASHYIGKIGIEHFYENTLHGQVGYQEVETDASGKSLRVLKETKSTPGKHIYLTIDSKLQTAAKKAMKGKRGAIVAIDPNTGQVLAMVSEPGYDPNLFVMGISVNDYRALQHSKDRPLYDRALRGLYPLASTIKPFVAIEGLNSGVIDPSDSIRDPGWFELPNSSHRYHDWLKYGHGTVNLKKALMYSCDTYFYELANKMGIRRMHSALTQFGFGAMSGLDLDGELPGNVPNPEWKRKAKGAPWYLGDTIISGIGQGFMQTTPLQLAVATATLASRGKRFAPHLLLAEQHPEGLINPYSPAPLVEIMLNKPEYWGEVIDGMQSSITAPGGTGRRFGITPYPVAAKTGTAQIISKRNTEGGLDNQDDIPERLRDHHLFIAFAPANEPKLALAVITENSNDAVSTARLIFDYYLGNNTHADQNPKASIQQTSS